MKIRYWTKIYADAIRFNVRLNHIALIFVGGMFLGLSQKEGKPVRMFRILLRDTSVKASLTFPRSTEKSPYSTFNLTFSPDFETISCSANGCVLSAEATRRVNKLESVFTTLYGNRIITSEK